MKFTLAALAIAATAVMAAPAPEAEPEPWCLRPGEGCWKVKRAAEAFAEAISSSGGISERSPAAEYSNQYGGAAYMAKRHLNEVANLIALSQNDPVSFYKQLELENQLDHDTEGDKNEKRDASPAPEPWCLRPGEGCWKRGADAVSEDKRWCLRPGEGCWKAKRAAEAVLAIVGRDAENVDSKPFAPAYFAKRDAEPWCLRPGEGCWKRSADANPEPWCLRPGEGCWKAKRDILAMRSAAMEIINAYA